MARWFRSDRGGLIWPSALGAVDSNHCHVFQPFFVVLIFTGWFVIFFCHFSLDSGVAADRQEGCLPTLRPYTAVSFFCWRMESRSHRIESLILAWRVLFCNSANNNELAGASSTAATSSSFPSLSLVALLDQSEHFNCSWQFNRCIAICTCITGIRQMPNW